MVKTERKTVTLPKTIISRIGKVQPKDVSFSRFIVRLLEIGLGIKEQEEKNV